MADRILSCLWLVRKRCHATHFVFSTVLITYQLHGVRSPRAVIDVRIGRVVGEPRIDDVARDFSVREERILTVGHTHVLSGEQELVHDIGGRVTVDDH